MVEEAESGASARPPDAFGTGVDAFDAAVVVGQGEASVHGGPVDFETVCEAAEVRQIEGPGRRDPLGAFHVVALGRLQQGSEATYEIGECGRLRSGRRDLVQQRYFLRVQVFGFVNGRPLA